MHEDLTRGLAALKAQQDRGPDAPAADPRGPRLTIGTGPDCDWIIRDVYCSRHHATIYRRIDGSIWVRDEGSLNGVRINGLRRYDAPVHPGDVLTIGRTEMRIPEWN